jgi:hypothetical protein
MVYYKCSRACIAVTLISITKLSLCVRGFTFFFFSVFHHKQQAGTTASTTLIADYAELKQRWCFDSRDGQQPRSPK